MTVRSWEVDLSRTSLDEHDGCRVVTEGLLSREGGKFGAGCNDLASSLKRGSLLVHIGHHDAFSSGAGKLGVSVSVMGWPKVKTIPSCSAPEVQGGYLGRYLPIAKFSSSLLTGADILSGKNNHLSSQTCPTNHGIQHM